MYKGGNIQQWYDGEIAAYTHIADYKSVIMRGALDGTILEVSPAAKVVLGYEPEFLVGKSGFDYIHPCDLIDFLTPFHNGEVEIATFTYRSLHASGDYILLETTATIQRDVITNKPKQILAISHDVYEKRKKYNEMNNIDNIAIVEKIAGGFAHEISNPLTTIKGFLQLMKTESNVNQEYLSLMLGELYRIEEIIQEFMGLGKRQTDKVQIINVKQALVDVLLILEPRTAEKNIQFVCDKPAPPVFIEANETKIKQVFINIIKNAIEAMAGCGGTITIKVSFDKDIQKVTISIHDEGHGISEADLKKIGTPFFTTKENGNGLGLMMCYRIIEQYKGNIMIESKVGIGTTFFIKMPMGDRSF